MKPVNFVLICITLFISIAASAQTMGWACFTNPSGDTMKLGYEPRPFIKNSNGDIFFTSVFFNQADTGYLVKWNDTTWEQVDVNANKQAFRHIGVICNDKHDNIYGVYATQVRLDIAKWDGTAWIPVGTGPDTIQSYYAVYAMGTDTADNIYVSTFRIQPNTQVYVAKWDGHTWTDITQGSIADNHKVLALCSDGKGNMYAAGALTKSLNNFFVAKWDGNIWTEVGTGPNALNANGVINALFCDGTDLYAAGGFTNTSGNNYVARWDGTTWSEVGGANAFNKFGDINALYKDATTGKLYAAGIFKNAANCPYVAVYDGTGWSELGAASYPLDVNFLYSIYINSLCGDDKGNIYASGKFYEKNGNGLTYIARYTDVTHLSIGKMAAAETGVEVYPNPTNGLLTINTAANAHHTTYSIYNMGGMVVQTGILTGNTATADMRNLPAGTYILQLGKGNHYMVKVQKM